MGTIRLCFEDEIMYHVMNVESPAKVWMKLESHYMSKSLTNKVHLKQQLHGLQMLKGTDLIQHTNVLNQIISDLLLLEIKFNDKDKAMILSCSLPLSYDHLVTMLMWGKETFELEEVISTLLAYNQQKLCTRESSQGEGLIMKGYHDCGRKIGMVLTKGI